MLMAPSCRLTGPSPSCTSQGEVSMTSWKNWDEGTIRVGTIKRNIRNEGDLDSGLPGSGRSGEWGARQVPDVNSDPRPDYKVWVKSMANYQNKRLWINNPASVYFVEHICRALFWALGMHLWTVPMKESWPWGACILSREQIQQTNDKVKCQLLWIKLK